MWNQQYDGAKGTEKKYCICDKEMHLVTCKTTPEMRSWRRLKKACRKEVSLRHDTFYMVINGEDTWAGATSMRKSACLMASPGNQQSVASAGKLSGVPSWFPSLPTLPATCPLSLASSQLLNCPSLPSPVTVSCCSTHSLSLPSLSSSSSSYN